jgi:hypothetical protein
VAASVKVELVDEDSEVLELDADELELVKSLITEAAVLLMADTFKLTDTEADAAELDEDEVSSSVDVDEYV